MFSSTDNPAIGEYIDHQESKWIIIITFYLVGNDDYDSGPYTVTFPSGVANASFNVTIIDNDQYESTETFYLIINSFSLPYNMYISNPSQAIVIISDDDSEYNYVCITFTPKQLWYPCHYEKQRCGPGWVFRAKISYDWMGYYMHEKFWRRKISLFLQFYENQESITYVTEY